jgi:hypothetical protein
LSLVSQLSSQVGDRTDASNLRVVDQCLADPSLLGEIKLGLTADEGLVLHTSFLC